MFLEKNVYFCVYLDKEKSLAIVVIARLCCGAVDGT